MIMITDFNLITFFYVVIDYAKESSLDQNSERESKLCHGLWSICLPDGPLFDPVILKVVNEEIMRQDSADI